MKTKQLLCISMALITSNLFASEGGMGSGGGKGIICFDQVSIAEDVRANSGKIYHKYLSNITSIEAIDLNFAKLPIGFEQKKQSIVSLNAGADFQAYIEKILKRIKITVPHLYHGIYNARSSFERGKMIFRNSPLTPVYDENDVATYETQNCVVSTLASQYKEFGVDYLHFDARLFNHPKHSEISKATLVLHEYLYLIARNEGTTDSRSTRKLIKYLIGNEPDMSLDKVVRYVVHSGFVKNQPEFYSAKEYSSKIDYTLHAGPINATYYMSTGYLHNIGKVVRNFDKVKPSYVRNKMEILTKATEIFRGLNISLKHRSLDSHQITISKALQILIDNEQVINESSFKETVKEIKNELNTYIKERGIAIQNEFERLTPVLFDQYAANLKSFLSQEEIEAIADISKNIGKMYLKLNDNPITHNGRGISDLYVFRNSVSEEKLFFSVEDLSSMHFPSLLTELKKNSKNKAHHNYIMNEIYTQYHKNGVLDYLSFKFPQI